jgi:hypothetical protein
MPVRRSHRLLPAVAAAAVLAAAAACSSATAAGGTPIRSILFIGNSLTFANDLPGMVALVAQADHDPVEVAGVTGSNLALIDHVKGATDAVARIDGGWGFVVLQQGPTPAGVCRDTLVLAAMRLAPHIRGAGARPVLFSPWARRQVPQSLDPAGESAGLAARAVGGVVAPVGIAWREALRADPSTPLYGPDGYHPAVAGTLLAALTIYDRVFGRDVRNLPPEALTQLPGLRLSAIQVRALTAAAHAASASLPADSPVAVPADTTRGSGGVGPC